ncbi:MAG: rhombosortase [Desulfobacteraceae bacterium]
MHSFSFFYDNFGVYLKPYSTIKKIIRSHWQLFTLISLIASVNWPLCYGEVRSELVFLPDAVKSGQWWRLVTFPFVHLSWYHLLLDAGGFLLVYESLTEKRLKVKLFYILIAGAGSLIMAMLMEPSISQRGLAGLSGIAHGLMAISGLEMLKRPDQRTWGGFYLILVIAKSTYELYTGEVMFQFMHMGMCGFPIAASHGGGVISGLLTFVIVNRKKQR